MNKATEKMVNEKLTVLAKKFADGREFETLIEEEGGEISAAVKFYDRKFTPEQMEAFKEAVNGSEDFAAAEVFIPYGTDDTAMYAVYVGKVAA